MLTDASIVCEGMLASVNSVNARDSRSARDECRLLACPVVDCCNAQYAQGIFLIVTQRSQNFW